MARVILAAVESIAGADVLAEGFLSIKENQFDAGSFAGFVLELACELEDNAHRGGGIISAEKSPVRIELRIDVSTEQAVDLVFAGGAKAGDQVYET